MDKIITVTDEIYIFGRVDRQYTDNAITDCRVKEINRVLRNKIIGRICFRLGSQERPV